jgi:hypothetical protein
VLLKIVKVLFKFILPITSNSLVGVEVPIPTYPLLPFIKNLFEKFK